MLTQKIQPFSGQTSVAHTLWYMITSNCWLYVQCAYLMRKSFFFFQSILAPLVQIPLFVSFFLALRKMAYLPVESFKTGGYLWFQDLTAFDPYFVLPVICSFSMLASIEVRNYLWYLWPGRKKFTKLKIQPVVKYYPSCKRQAKQS